MLCISWCNLLCGVWAYSTVENPVYYRVTNLQKMTEKTESLEQSFNPAEVEINAPK